MKIIALTNQKGGAGKSTIALNLAVAFSQSGFKTVIADADPQGTCQDWYSVRQEIQQKNDVSVFGVAKSVKAIKSLDAEVVIIDTQASFSLTTAEILALSDIVLIPVKPSPADVMASQEIALAAKKRKIIDPGLKVAFVLSQVKSNALMFGATIEALKEHEEIVTLSGTTELEIYKQSFGLGLGVAESDNKKAKDEILALMNNIINL